MQEVEKVENIWVLAHGSVIGRGHVSKNIPCQDSHEIKLLPGKSKWGVAAVSDGAGSCENSHIGSARVVSKCTDLLLDLLGNTKWAEDMPLPTQDEWYVIAKSIFNEVLRDLSSYACESELDLHSLSATLMAVIFGPEAILIAHIGDGRAAGQNVDGSWEALLTPYRGEEANVTAFITSKRWNESDNNDLFCATVYTKPYKSFALMTDGCEMATFEITRFNEKEERLESVNIPYAPFFNPNVQTLLMLHEQGKTQDEINQLWRNLLTNGTQRFADEPDDKTLILAVNKHLSKEAPVELVQTISPEKASILVIKSQKHMKHAKNKKLKPKFKKKKA